MRVALVTITEPVLLNLCFGAVIDSLTKLAQAEKYVSKQIQSED